MLLAGGGVQLKWLQWGRVRLNAETGTGLDAPNQRKERFNGAAFG